MFKNKKDKFAILLSNIAVNIQESANYFSATKINNVSDLKVCAEKMKDYEHRADKFVHEMIQELNHTFITPIEREDLLLLTLSLDEVMDELEHCAALREMYSLIDVDEFELKLLAELNRAAQLLVDAINLLVGKNIDEIQSKVIAIKDSESICDNIYRAAVKDLFTTKTDPIHIMKHKEMYESLENASDFCQSAANVIETIVMKNV